MPTFDAHGSDKPDMSPEAMTARYNAALKHQDELLAQFLEDLPVGRYPEWAADVSDVILDAGWHFKTGTGPAERYQSVIDFYRRELNVSDASLQVAMVEPLERFSRTRWVNIPMAHCFALTLAQVTASMVDELESVLRRVRPWPAGCMRDLASAVAWLLMDAENQKAFYQIADEKLGIADDTYALHRVIYGLSEHTADVVNRIQGYRIAFRRIEQPTTQQREAFIFRFVELLETLVGQPEEDAFEAWDWPSKAAASGEEVDKAQLRAWLVLGLFTAYAKNFRNIFQVTLDRFKHVPDLWGEWNG